MGWQWHQLNHMQIICTSLQTDNHASTSSLNVLQAGCSSQNNEGKITRMNIRMQSQVWLSRMTSGTEMDLPIMEFTWGRWHYQQSIHNHWACPKSTKRLQHNHLLWPPYVIWGHYIFALWFLSSIYLSSSFFPCLISAATGWMSTMVWP